MGQLCAALIIIKSSVIIIKSSVIIIKVWDSSVPCHRPLTLAGGRAASGRYLSTTFLIWQVVELLLAEDSGVGCLSLRNSAGSLPAQVTDASKKSAGSSRGLHGISARLTDDGGHLFAAAPAAKKIRALMALKLAEQSQQSRAQQGEAAKAKAGSGKAAAKSEKARAKGKREGKAAVEEADSAGGAGGAAAADAARSEAEPVKAALSDAETLHMDITGASTHETRRGLGEQLKRSPSERKVPGDFLIPEPLLPVGAKPEGGKRSPSLDRAPTPTSDTCQTSESAQAGSEKVQGRFREGSGKEKVQTSESAQAAAAAVEPAAMAPAAAAATRAECEAATSDTCQAGAPTSASPPADAQSDTDTRQSRSSRSSFAPTADAPTASSPLEQRFEHLPWRVLIVRPAARDLSALDAPDKTAAIRALLKLASGIWSGHDVKHLAGPSIPSELSLYESRSRFTYDLGEVYL